MGNRKGGGGNSYCGCLSQMRRPRVVGAGLDRSDGSLSRTRRGGGRAEKNGMRVFNTHMNEKLESMLLSVGSDLRRRRSYRDLSQRVFPRCSTLFFSTNEVRLVRCRDDATDMVISLEMRGWRSPSFRTILRSAAFERSFCVAGSATCSVFSVDTRSRCDDSSELSLTFRERYPHRTVL